MSSGVMFNPRMLLRWKATFTMTITERIQQAIMTKRLNSYRLVTTQERIECWQGKKLVGFAVDDVLHAINPANGFSELVGNVNHRSEIAGKLAAYRFKSD
jgi:hypothetical protein